MKYFRISFFTAHVSAMLSGCMSLTTKDAGAELQRALDSKIGGRLNVPHGALLVDSRAKDFYWAGAAGMADPAAGVRMTADTPFHTASVGKMFTAVSIGRLVEEGRMSFDDPIAKYLSPEIMDGLHVFEGKDYSGDILIRHLLGHSSGLPDFFYDAPAQGESFIELAKNDPGRFWTPEETVRFAKENLKPFFPPGAGFHYADTEYNLLGLILERVTGLTLAEVFFRDFFGPLGMSRSYLYLGTPRDTSLAHVFFGDWDVTDSMPLISASWAACGVVSTLEDMRKFMRAFAAGKLLSETTMARMRSEARVFEEVKGIDYGYGLMLIDFPALSPFLGGFPSAWGHSGSTGAFLYYCPELDAVFAGTLDQQATESTHMMLVIEAIGILLRLP
jgi:D-alanyl-D-alanine carboxypeptidase